MARNFDFKKYKAIVDYIQSSTGSITTSIDNLIKGSVELRANSVASIIKYSTSIKEVVIGRIKTAIGSDRWISEGEISLDITAGGTPVFTEDYIYDPDVMLPSILNSSIVDKVGEKFVKRSSGIIVLQREYDPAVDTFLDTEIPSVSFFKSNYVTKDSAVVYGKIVLSSDSIIERKSAVNKIIAEKLSGTSKAKKTVYAYSKKVLSNFFDVSSDESISLSSVPTSLVVGQGVTIQSAPSEKSLITTNNVDSAVVRKDLKNIRRGTMIMDGSDDVNIMTDSAAVSDIVSSGTEYDDVTIIPKTCQPNYSTTLIHPAIEADNDAVKDKIDFMDIENTLSLDKEEVDVLSLQMRYFSLFAVATTGYNPTPDEVLDARGRMATTIKSVYEMVAARLLIANSKLFIDNAEYIAQQTTSSLFLKPTSSPEFSRRPMSLANTNDGAIVTDMADRLKTLECSSTGGKVRSW
jgi:hypothetical protein